LLGALGALGGQAGGAKAGVGETKISIVAGSQSTKTVTAAGTAQNSTCAAAEEKTVTVTQNVAAASASGDA
jgi:hypothetical protein